MDAHNTKTAEQIKRRQYHVNFINKNADKIKQQIICDVCGVSYTYFNKSKHFRSKKHNKASDCLSKIKNDPNLYRKYINMMVKDFHETVKPF
jgi:hypothetical protein